MNWSQSTQRRQSGIGPTAVADVVTGTVQACTFGLGGMFSGGSTLCVADIGPIGFEAVMGRPVEGLAQYLLEPVNP